MGSKFQPNSEEIRKAVVLSSLAYFDGAEKKAALENRYSRIGLDKVVMAQDFILGECNQNNSSTLFVAFRWRLRIQDMFARNVAGKNEFDKSYSREATKDVGGSFHNELFQRITSYLPSMSYFNNFQADKIIFSGHSLAGALAHLFLICYMLNSQEEAKRHISIGFGSPNFCDSDAKRFCEKSMELDRRMFTLVNGADPVPWLLTGIRMANPESRESAMAESLSTCFDSLNTWLVQANSGEIRIEIEANMLQILNTTLKKMQPYRFNSRSRIYISVGAYYEGKELNSVNPVTNAKLTDVNAWHCHRVECYVEEFSFYGNRERFPIRCIIEESSPCIHDCNLNIYRGPESHEGVIAIRGFGLSELKDFHVFPNVGREWRVEKCSNDNNILLSGVLSETEAFAINTQQTHLSVDIRTCFGSTGAEVNVENLWRDSYVAYALNRAMGRLLLMQQSMVLRESDEFSEAYEAIHCVRDPFYLSEETKKEYCETLKLLLTGPVETPVPNFLQNLKYGWGFAESAEELGRKVYVFLSTSFLSRQEDLYSVIPGNSSISRLANQNESSSSSYVYCICDNKLRKLNYLDILKTIYYLLSDTESEHEQSVDAYEQKIYRHVRRDGQLVKRRQGLPEGVVTDIQDRAWKIYKIIGACNLLEGFRMAALIGPENVGKTTLINSVLGENAGVVGYTTHTSAAALYMFTKDIFIIDFPGIDAGGERAALSNVWKYYEKAADLCIVVVNFGGDTSECAEKFVRIARSQMCENVVLVINRVDSVLNGSRNSPVWVEYSPMKVKQLRISFAESCGLPTERVFLSVSRPKVELDETTCRLLQERPTIMMKEEITSKLRQLLCGT